MKNRLILASLAVVLLFVFLPAVLAQNENKLDYGKELILDSDLDGLTDLGEKQIYKTEPMNQDSDGDGFLDGVEVIGNTDPLDKNVPGITKIINNQESRIEQETPWAWYISRASGLMAYFLLWWVMFFGLAIRTPILKSVFVPIFSLEIHCWLSLQSLFFVFFHAGSLLVDKYLNFNVWDIIVPFHSQTYTSEIALGILGLYLMAVLIITSYFKNIISQKIWRSIHWMNIVLFAIVTIHAFFIGTDLKNTPWLQNTFIGMNIFLIFIIIVNLSVRLKNAIFSKKA